MLAAKNLLCNMRFGWKREATHFCSYPPPKPSHLQRVNRARSSCGSAGYGLAGQWRGPDNGGGGQAMGGCRPLAPTTLSRASTLRPNMIPHAATIRGLPSPGRATDAPALSQVSSMPICSRLITLPTYGARLFANQDSHFLVHCLKTTQNTCYPEGSNVPPQPTILVKFATANRIADHATYNRVHSAPSRVAPEPAPASEGQHGGGHVSKPTFPQCQSHKHFEVRRAFGRGTKTMPWRSVARAQAGLRTRTRRGHLPLPTFCRRQKPGRDARVSTSAYYVQRFGQHAAVQPHKPSCAIFWNSLKVLNIKAKSSAHVDCMHCSLSSSRWRCSAASTPGGSAPTAVAGKVTRQTHHSSLSQLGNGCSPQFAKPLELNPTS